MANSRARIVPILLSQGIGLACGIAGVKLMSRWVPPATLGAYGIFLSFASIGMSVAHVGLVKYVIRHWAGAEDRGAFSRNILRRWAARLPWLALLCVPITWGLGQMAEISPLGLYVLLLVATSFQALLSLAQVALQAARAHWPDCAVSTVASLTRTFAPPLLFVATGSAAGLYLGFTAHALAAIAVAAWFLRRHWLPIPRGSPPVPADAFVGPIFVVLALVGWILTGVNRWIVAGYFGETTAGYFTLGSNAAVLVPSMLGSITLQYFQPGFFALADDPDPGVRERLARRVDLVAAGCFAVAMAGLAALAIVAPWLVGPLIAENYRPALRWILPAGCFGLAITTGLFFHTLLLAGRRERFCGPVDLTAGVVLVGGGMIAAALGEETFRRWLLATPVLPWIVNRPLALRYFRLMPDAAPTPAPGR